MARHRLDVDTDVLRVVSHGGPQARRSEFLALGGRLSKPVLVLSVSSLGWALREAEMGRVKTRRFDPRTGWSLEQARELIAHGYLGGACRGLHGVAAGDADGRRSAGMTPAPADGGGCSGPDAAVVAEWDLRYAAAVSECGAANPTLPWSPK